MVNSIGSLMDMGINSSTFSTWKKRGVDPDVKYIPCICDILGVSIDFLLTGEDKNVSCPSNNPVLNDYRWYFPEKSEDDILYNRICYALCMLHGRVKANILLSAVMLPCNTTFPVRGEVLKWLAYKSNVSVSFLTSPPFVVGKTNAEELNALARSYFYN